MIGNSITGLNVARSFIRSAQRVRNISTTSRLNDIFKVQNEKDFEERVLNVKGRLIIVDFMATWCGPCKLLTPRIESLVNEHKDKVSLAKVDIDELTDLSLEHDVQAVPVLAAFKDGKVVNKLIGLQDTDIMRKWIKSHIE